MPYKSKSQQRLFHYLQSKGKLPKKKVDEFDQSTDYSDIPEKMWSGGVFVDPDDDQDQSAIDANSENEDEVTGNFHPYVSSGEPHTDDDLEYDHPMEYMNKGGMVSHLNRGDKKPKKSLQQNLVQGAIKKKMMRGRR